MRSLYIGTSASQTVATNNFIVDGTVLIGTTTDNGFKLIVSGTQYVSGNVSIGTSYNGFALNVAGTTYVIGASVWVQNGYGYVNSGATSTGVFPMSDNTIEFRNNNATNLLIDASGNVGIKATPSAWASGYSVLNVGDAAAISWTGAGANDFSFSTNAYYDTTDNRWEYRGTGDGSARYSMTALSYEHRWYNAPVGTANAAISYTQAMTLTGGGNLLIGTTTDAGYKLRVNGSSYFDAPILCYTGNAYITAITSDGVGSNNGFGYSFLITGANHEIGRVTGIYETSGGGGSGGLGFWTRGSGTLSNKMTLSSGGTLTLSNYGSGSKTGTPAYNLGVDSSGNVIELPGGVVDGSGTANYVTKWQDENTVTNSIIRDDGTTVGINQAPGAAKFMVNGSVTGGGQTTYSKGYGSIDTTGYAVAGLVASSNGDSSLFTFTCRGGAMQYQRIVYSCYNAGGNWYTNKVIDEGTNAFDVTASADGATITFTFKGRTAGQGYSPGVLIEQFGGAIDTTYL